MSIGDLVSFKHSSIGVPIGSIGLIVEMRAMITMSGETRYFLYDVQTSDGKVRRFTDSYFKKID